MGIFGSPAKVDPLPPPTPLPPAAHPASLASVMPQTSAKNKVAGLASTIATTPEGLVAPPDKAKTTLLGG